jgi:hypothetical protein
MRFFHFQNPHTMTESAWSTLQRAALSLKLSVPIKKSCKTAKNSPKVPLHWTAQYKSRQTEPYRSLP